MRGINRLNSILSAALITLSFLGELALPTRFILISFLQIMLLWGVTAYANLMLSSWLHGEEFLKEKDRNRVRINNHRLRSGFHNFRAA